LLALLQLFFTSDLEYLGLLPDVSTSGETTSA
jgi:hypothetical protein